MYAYLSDGRAAAERPGVARHLTAVLIDPPDRSWQSAASSVLTHVLTGVSRAQGWDLTGDRSDLLWLCAYPLERPVGPQST